MCSDTEDDGCDGGITVYAYEYMSDAGGLVYNSTYPYISYWDVTETCIISDYSSSEYIVSTVCVLCLHCVFLLSCGGGVKWMPDVEPSRRCAISIFPYYFFKIFCSCVLFICVCIVCGCRPR